MRSNAAKFLALIFLILLYGGGLAAQSAKIVISGTANEFTVNNVPFVTDNNTQALTLLEVMSPAFAAKFKLSPKPVEITADKVCYWLKFQIVNKESNEIDRLLEFDKWQYVDFYIVDSPKTIIKKSTGRFAPYASRDVRLADRNLIELKLRPNEAVTCYVRLRSGIGDEYLPENLSFRILNTATELTKQNTNLNLIYFFCGIYLVMFLYNLFIFFSTKETGYFYYLCILIFAVGALMSNSGYTVVIFKGSSSFPRWFPIIDVVFSALFGFQILMFAKEFLKMRQNMPLLNKLFNVMIFCLPGMVIPVLFGNLILANVVSSIMGLVTMGLVLTAAVQGFRKKYHSSFLFLVAYAFFTLGVGVFLLKEIGIIPVTTLTQFSIELGTSAEAILFSLALADRINILKKQNDENRQRIIEQLNEYSQLQVELNHELEEKVEQRTQELRDSQKQLLQKEKLAALGELTAGIAHEIQNPLNFVNNFSEINVELMTDLEEEITKKNYDEVNAITAGLKENTLKVIHHGKRADKILKAMLMHSAAGSGSKEKVNLNELAEEYLRLSYKGNRARDKSLKAIIQTNFDEQLISIEVVKSEFGRALMNIYNNAFFAVAEKHKQGNSGYEPSVTVSTKSLPKGINITIRDNGTGIPLRVISKIFQPFFTTKPTGEGTGLGLSLSYDTIKAHGGEITVNTLEGEFTEFIISLPI